MERDCLLNLVLGGNMALIKSISPAKINRTRNFLKTLIRVHFDDVVKKYFPLCSNRNQLF